jgi:hypothetical protein
MTVGRNAATTGAPTATDQAAPARWARLTWQDRDPEALAAGLARSLGLAVVRSGGVWRLELGGEVLEVVPWRREGPQDEPARGGRIVLEPIDGGARVPEIVPDAPLALAAVVWATVELDRAEAELAAWLLAADPAAGDGDAPPDPLLGARARRRRTIALPGRSLLLAEPTTEGRLAATLARDGEGPCALYLRAGARLDTWAAAARARGVRLSDRRPGPLGPAVLLADAAAAGPHVLVVDAAGDTGSPAAAPSPGTIGS